MTTDHDEIDHRAVWRWLHDESYWARGRPWEIQQRAIAASRCLAVIGPEGDTRAYCRLVTDGATFAWLADVVVLPPFRGRGLGKDLVGAVVAHAAGRWHPPLAAGDRRRGGPLLAVRIRTGVIAVHGPDDRRRGVVTESERSDQGGADSGLAEGGVEHLA